MPVPVEEQIELVYSYLRQECHQLIGQANTHPEETLYLMRSLIVRTIMGLQDQGRLPTFIDFRFDVEYDTENPTKINVVAVKSWL